MDVSFTFFKESQPSSLSFSLSQKQKEAFYHAFAENKKKLFSVTPLLGEEEMEKLL